MYSKFVKPFLFFSDAEKAHHKAVKLAESTHNSELLQNLVHTIFGYENTDLEREFFGLKFPNPVGLAAGFDKNGTTPLAMQALGFGFVEIGSITAKASSGNPKPRAFRLPKDESLINRMGLNNEGADVIINRLKNLKLDIPLGINIAKTNDSSIHGKAAIEDYEYSFQKALEVADYITINISCPNTEEGITFENPDSLNALLDVLQPSKQNTPSLLKFSPNNEKATLQKLVEIGEKHGIAGYVATNTSTNRKGLLTDNETLTQIGKGGLSGKSISNESTTTVKWIYELLKGSKPIVGVGGVCSKVSAKEKIDAGADLLQIYTGLVYEGPGLVKKLKKGNVFL